MWCLISAGERERGGVKGLGRVPYKGVVVVCWGREDERSLDAEEGGKERGLQKRSWEARGKKGKKGFGGR